MYRGALDSGYLGSEAVELLYGNVVYILYGTVVAGQWNSSSAKRNGGGWEN